MKNNNAKMTTLFITTLIIGLITGSIYNEHTDNRENNTISINNTEDMNTTDDNVAQVATVLNDFFVFIE